MAAITKLLHHKNIIPRKSLSILDEILETLKDKITNKIMGKIDSIMSVKSKEFLAQNHQENNDDALLLHHELNAVKHDWMFLQSEIEKLKNKADHIQCHRQEKTLGGGAK